MEVWISGGVPPLVEVNIHYSTFKTFDRCFYGIFAL